MQRVSEHNATLRCVRPERFGSLLPGGKMLDAYRLEDLDDDVLTKMSESIEVGTATVVDAVTPRMSVTALGEHSWGGTVRRRLSHSTTVEALYKIGSRKSLVNEASRMRRRSWRDRSGVGVRLSSSMRARSARSAKAAVNAASTHKPRSLGTFVLEDMSPLSRTRRNALLRIGPSDEAGGVNVEDLFIWAALMCDMDLARLLYAARAAHASNLELHHDRASGKRRVRDPHTFALCPCAQLVAGGRARRTRCAYRSRHVKS